MHWKMIIVKYNYYISRLKCVNSMSRNVTSITRLRSYLLPTRSNKKKITCMYYGNTCAYACLRAALDKGILITEFKWCLFNGTLYYRMCQ